MSFTQKNDSLNTALNKGTNDRPEYILGGNTPFYIVDSSRVDNDGSASNIGFIPPIEEVKGISYVPYLSIDDFEGTYSQLNDIYFGAYQYGDDGDQYAIIPNLYRILCQINKIKEVGTFNPFNNITGKDIGGSFKWENEGKLWLYPFHYGTIYDGISSKMNYSLQDLPVKENTIKIRYALNTQGVYTLFINGLYGDTNGLMFGQVSSGVTLPVSNSIYGDYIANNKNTIDNALLNSILGGVVSAATGLATGGLAGGAIGLVSGGLSVTNTIVGEMAKQQDLLNQGLSLSQIPNEGMIGLINESLMRNYFFGYRECDLELIAKQFHLYGYAQNKLMQPSFKGRKYWNYLQTADCHLKVPNCPKEHLQQLKQIFDSGVTVWHKANGEMFENTDKDNVEI